MEQSVVLVKPDGVKRGLVGMKVEIVRKIVGSTYPQAAPPGTIRGDFSYDSPLLSNLKRRSVHNLIHASGKPEEAEKGGGNVDDGGVGLYNVPKTRQIGGFFYPF